MVPFLSMLDPETTAKVGAVSAIAQGFFMNVAPKQTNTKYGLTEKDNTEQNQFVTAHTGFALLSYGIMMYCLLFEKTTLQVAIQVVNILWVYHQTSNVLGGKIDKFTGGDNTGFWFTIFVFAFNAFAMTQEYAVLVIQATTLLWLLTGLQMVLNPDGAAKAWKMEKAEESSFGTLLLRLFGYCLLADAVVIFSLLFWECSPVEAYGYSLSIWACFHAVHLMDGSFKGASLNEIPQMLWLLWQLTQMTATIPFLRKFIVPEEMMVEESE